MNILLALFILWLSYVIRAFIGLNHRAFVTNKIPIFYSATSQFIALIIWIGLLLWAGIILYSIGIIYLVIGLVLYFFIFDFLFLKHFIRYFGGDLAFPDNLKHCEGIIKAMVDSYICRKKVYKNKNEKEILFITLKSRYPFMKSKKGKAIVEKCSGIKELIYEVLKIDFINFDVKKSKPIKEQVDKIIGELYI